MRNSRRSSFQRCSGTVVHRDRIVDVKAHQVLTYDQRAGVSLSRRRNEIRLGGTAQERNVRVNGELWFGPSKYDACLLRRRVLMRRVYHRWKPALVGWGKVNNFVNE